MTPTLTYAEGFAVVDDHGLNIHTVSGSHRTSIIAWLAEAGIPVAPAISDDELRYLWMRYATNPRRATIKLVEIRVKSAT